MTKVPLINNHFKCEWIKLSNQKIAIDRIDKTHAPTVCSLQKAPFRIKDTERSNTKDQKDIPHKQ